MGLLDLLSGGSGGGGLLDFLNSPSFADRFNALPPQPGTLMGTGQPASFASRFDASSPPPIGQNQPSPLDNAQWPAGPNGAPVSFADRFNAAPNAPQPFQGGGRTFDSAQFDPQTYAPNQAQPIAVGNNYQMPRMGGADQYNPPQQSAAALPPNAQPTQGQLPQGAPIQQPAPMQAPQQQTMPNFLGGQQGAGIGDRLSAGMNNFANAGGLLPALVGGISGLANGQRTDPQGVALQDRRAQFDAVKQTLIQGGMSPGEAQSKAMLAVMNPEAGKTILQEVLTSKEKYGVVSEDPFAGKKYGFINERDQTVNGKPINAQAAGSSTPLVDMENAKAAGVTGNALYEYLPKQIAPMVRAMIEGRQPLPSGAAMRNPATLALIDAAHSIDPTFDATSWKGRQAGVVDYTSGKSSEMVRSANQTLHHVNSLLDSMDALKNGSYPLLNRVGNAAAEATGSGAQGSFRTNAHAVAEELSKVFKGSNLSDAEIHAWEQNLHENMSPEQQKTQIAKLKELLGGSLHALEEKRLAAIGPMAAEKAGPIIKEDAQRVMKRIDEWVKGGKGAASATPADPLGIR